MVIEMMNRKAKLIQRCFKRFIAKRYQSITKMIILKLRLTLTSACAISKGPIERKAGRLLRDFLCEMSSKSKKKQTFRDFYKKIVRIQK
mmetsp:Transcript_37790/g.36224  ORF Transcript_37790/g.36224 Transcript_37790/m.36224 type:complete len:89 (-) Transcript_37790:356-622(-)